jgi:hypothetical protein
LDREARAKAQESGMMPLDYLLSIMHDEMQDAAVRRDAAKAAAPYCHARLASTEISGPNAAAIPVDARTTRVLDVSDLSIQELEVLRCALVKACAGLEAEDDAA